MKHVSPTPSSTLRTAKEAATFKYVSQHEPNFSFAYTEAPILDRASSRNGFLPSFLVDELFLDDADDTAPINCTNAAPISPTAKSATANFRIPSPASSLPSGAQCKDSVASHGQATPLNSDLSTLGVQISSPRHPISLISESHISPSTTSSSNADLCAFSILGKCRYGNYCRNVHGLQCPRCLMYVLHPTDMERNEEHIYQCFERPASLAMSELEQIECGLCHQPVLHKVDPRFGLLNCNHAFCLSCIRAWRSTHFDANNENPRSCPECREVTYFIVPSSTWIEDSLEKTRVIDQYKRKMSAIPCKYFEFGGECPFGSSCFYEHRSDPSIPPSDTQRPLSFFNAPPAHVVEHSERLAKAREAKLSDYIIFKTVPSLNKKK